ncbi:MAG: hypothetical protein V2J20_03030 [Wenzhouxiangella sp.]|nr:hypothetical protein [Wenzhouxiangella sp.]
MGDQIKSPRLCLLYVNGTTEHELPDEDVFLSEINRHQQAARLH